MSHSGHIPSTADHSSDALLAQKIAAVVRAYGTNGQYSNHDMHFLIEEVPNVRKIVVLLYAQDRVNGVLAFEYRFVKGQGVQGEVVTHRPNGDRWETLIENLYQTIHGS